MARTYGVEFPGRSLMDELSDLLGIERFTTARGATVRRDFLEAIAVRLGHEPGLIESLRTKDDVLALVVQTSTREPMDPELFSPGETVTDHALAVILQGLRRHGVPNSQ